MKTIAALLFIGSIPMLAADPSLKAKPDPTGKVKYVERSRIIVDLDGDGTNDMLLSGGPEEFGTMGGPWAVYLNRDGDYKRIGEVWAHPRAVAFEPDQARIQTDPKSHRFARVWVYLKASGSAGSFGYFVSPVLVKYSLNESGWENTIFYFCLLLGLGLLVALFVSTPKIPVGENQNKDQSAVDALKEAFANKSFIYLTLGFFVCGWHIALVATHIPTDMMDKGLPDWCATAVLSLIGLFNMVGTITSGYLSTRYSKKKILSAIYLLRGVSIMIFIFFPPSVINSIIFGITFGFLWLSTVPPTNGIVAHIFGTKYVGMLYGIVFVSHQIGSFLGAYLGGVFYEMNGNFDYAWYGSIALSIFAGLIHLPINEKPIERLQTA